MKSMSVDVVGLLIRDPSERERIIRRMATQSSRYRRDGIEDIVDKRKLARPGVSEAARGRIVFAGQERQSIR